MANAMLPQPYRWTYAISSYTVPRSTRGSRSKSSLVVKWLGRRTYDQQIVRPTSGRALSG